MAYSFTLLEVFLRPRLVSTNEVRLTRRVDELPAAE